MANEQILPAAEFQSLPLEFIIAAPLAGAVKAQAVAAEQTKSFIQAFKGDNVDFSAATFTNGAQRSVDVKVPLLALVPVPHLRIDSLTVNFKYEISQVVADKRALEAGVDLEAGTTGFLSNSVEVTIRGSVTIRACSAT